MGRPAQRNAGPAPGGVRELLHLAWPLIVGNSLLALQILIDRILLGRAGGHQVGAALATALVFWTVMSLFQNTANYATTFVAQYTGAGRPRRVGPVIWQSLYFSLAGGVVFLTLIPPAEMLMSLAGHSGHVQELETAYFRCLCFAAPPTLLTASALSFFAGRGDSRTVLAVNVVGLTVNVVIASVLIYGLFGFPRLGIAGAGWATVLGSSSSALLSLALLFRRRHRAEFATLDGWRFDAGPFARLMRFGLPNGLAAGLDTLGFALFTLLVGRMGDAELDATSIAFALNLLAFLPLLGVGQAVEILVGRRLGENDPATAERSTWMALRFGLAITGNGGRRACSLFPGAMAELFHSDDAQWDQVRAAGACVASVRCGVLSLRRREPGLFLRPARGRRHALRDDRGADGVMAGAGAADVGGLHLRMGLAMGVDIRQRVYYHSSNGVFSALPPRGVAVASSRIEPRAALQESRICRSLGEKPPWSDRP